MQDDKYSVSHDYISQLEKEISTHEKELTDDPENDSLRGRIGGLKRALLIYRMLTKSKSSPHQISIEID